MKLKIPIDVYQLGDFLEGEFVVILREPYGDDVIIVECEPDEVIVSLLRDTGVPIVRIDKEIVKIRNGKEDE